MTKKKTTILQEKQNGFHLVLGCVHIPYENKILLRKLFELIEDNRDKIIGFHLIGDFMDLKSLSSHDDKTIDFQSPTLGQEYNAGNLILDQLDNILPHDISKTFIYGNHEDRFFRYTSNVKNYKTADAMQSPTFALKLKERGYKVLENWKEDYIKIGKYQLFHGIACTTNSSKTHVDKLRSSCIFAHTHRIGQHYEGWLHGVNIGTLGDLDSKGFSYLSRVERSTWKNGFGVINTQGSVNQAEVIVCENNGFFFNGKRY